MDETHTFFWLVGLFEGEASFMYNKTARTPIIELEMTDEHVVARVASLFGLSYYRRDRRESHPNSRVSYRTVLRGVRAMHLMKRLQPYLSPRRARTIDSIELRYLEARTLQKDYDRIPLPPLTDVPYTLTRE